MQCNITDAEAVFKYSFSSVQHAGIFGGILLAVGLIFIKNKISSAYFSGHIMVLGIVLSGFGVLALVVVMPSLYFSERIVFGRQEMCSSGLWFWPVHEGFTYSNVDYILKKVSPTRENKGHTDLQVIFKNGTKIHMSRSDLWADNEIEISKVLRNHGIELRE